jgi:hypothetical protein
MSQPTTRAELEAELAAARALYDMPGLNDTHWAALDRMLVARDALAALPPEPPKRPDPKTRICDWCKKRIKVERGIVLGRQNGTGKVWFHEIT